MMLQDLIHRIALRSPESPALREATGIVTYREIDQRANRLARALFDLEVRPGDRVAVWLDHSTASVLAAQAILRLGAVYVPVDPSANPKRTSELLIDAGPRVLVSTDARAAEVLTDELSHVTCVTVDRSSLGISWSEVESYPAEPIEDIVTSASNVAALLYPRSGATVGKGICLSHAALLASVTWLAAELRLESADRLVSQAPPADLLALVDQHAAFLMGASVSLMPEPLRMYPGAVLAYLANQEATAWTTHGAFLDVERLAHSSQATDVSGIGRILISGDPPAPNVLREVAGVFPDARVLGVLGAPETGLCAWYEPDEGASADEVPVGTPCAGARMWAIGRDGKDVQIGEEGELVLQGPTVLLGYWGRPTRGGLPYFTGRIVRREDDERYTFTGWRGLAVRNRRETRQQPAERI